MSLVFPGYDTKHIIKQAMNAKTLGQLGRIENSSKPDKEIKSNTCENKFSMFKKNAIKQAEGKHTDEILEYAGLLPKELSDGTKGIAKYHQPSINYTWADIGIDERELIKGVTKVSGNLNLINTSLENTDSISVVNGDISIGGKNSLKDLSSLKYVYGSVIIHSKSKDEALKTLKDLKFKPQKFSGKVIVL